MKGFLKYLLSQIVDHPDQIEIEEEQINELSFQYTLKAYFASSIPGRAEKKGLVQIRLVNIRDYAYDSHKTVDDRPYGGGAGMILKVDIVHKAIEANRLKDE